MHLRYINKYVNELKMAENEQLKRREISGVCALEWVVECLLIDALALLIKIMNCLSS